MCRNFRSGTHQNHGSKLWAFFFHESDIGFGVNLLGEVGNNLTKKDPCSPWLAMGNETWSGCTDQLPLAA